MMTPVPSTYGNATPSVFSQTKCQLRGCLDFDLRPTQPVPMQARGGVCLP